MEIVKEKNIQVMVTTHSLETIIVASNILKEFKLDSRFKFLENENGILKVRDFSSEEAEILNKLGIDLRLLEGF